MRLCSFIVPVRGAAATDEYSVIEDSRGNWAVQRNGGAVEVAGKEAVERLGEGLAGVGVVSRARTAHLRDAVVERPSGQDTTECRLRTYKLRTRTSLSPVRAPGL